MDIPPQEFGYLQATVDKLEDRVEKLTTAVEALTATLNPFEQKSFVLLDASVILYSEDEKYSLALIGRNLGDEIIARGAGARPGACVNYNPEAEPAGRCKAEPLANEQDQSVTTSLGREVLVRFKMKI